MPVRCPVVCPRYVRGMSRTMSVRCPYDVRAISCDIYTSRALSRFFFFSAVLSSPDFKFLNSKKLNVRCPYDVRHVRGMSVVCPYDVRTMSVRCPVVCPWYVRGMSVVCPWYVRGMSRASGHTERPPLVQMASTRVGI